MRKRKAALDSFRSGQRGPLRGLALDASRDAMMTALAMRIVIAETWPSYRVSLLTYGAASGKGKGRLAANRSTIPLLPSSWAATTWNEVGGTASKGGTISKIAELGSPPERDHPYSCQLRAHELDKTPKVDKRDEDRRAASRLAASWTFSRRHQL